jgi:S-layer domain protein
MNKKFLLVAGVLSIINGSVMAESMYNSVNLGVDNTLVAGTYANIAVGNMNTTDTWAIAVGAENISKDNSTIIGRKNNGETYSIIVGEGNKDKVYSQNLNEKGYNTIIGHDSSIDNNHSIAIGRQVHIKSDENTDRNNFGGSIAIGSYSKVTGNRGIAIGYLAEASEGNIAFGNATKAVGSPDKVDPNNKFGFLGWNAKRDSYSMASFGGRQLKGVTPGAMTESSTDAVNGSQLYYVAKEALKKATVSSGKNIDVKKYNDSNYIVHMNNDIRDLTSINVVDNIDSTDNRVNINGNELKYSDNSGHRSSTLSKNNLTVEDSQDSNYLKSTTYGADGISIQRYDGDFNLIDSVTLTNNGLNNGGHKITNVSKGIKDTDAVNVKQLKDYVAANGSVDTNTITTVTNGDNATVTGITDASGNKEFKVAVNKDLTDMNSARFVSGDNETKVDGTEITFKSDKDQVHTEVQAGSIGVSTEKNRTVIYEDGVIIGNAAETELSTSDSSGLSVTNADGKKVEFKLNNVSVGDNQIHDVATGIADTDAVNVKQLKEYMSTNDKDTITTVKAGNNIEVMANGHDYTVSLNKDVVDKIDNATAGVKSNADAIKSNADAIKSNADAIKANTADIADNKAQINNLVNQIGNNDTKINNMINNTRHEARRGIASASALAALHPLDYNPDHKVDVMSGVGHYRGKTAVALGAAYRPNENLMFTVGTAINGKDSSVNAGVSYKVGAKDSTYKSQASLAKDVEDLKQIVAKLQAELEEARKK